MFPDEIYYEPDALGYDLGKTLQEKYQNKIWIPIDSHNKIDELRTQPNSAFPRLKQHLIIGVRKTHKYVPNEKVSDFLVPYTSSGCTAMCLYCYLVCSYNKCSYLRLFVNREEMMKKMIKTANSSPKDLTFEIGSNSDLILENTITNNLVWTIEKFAASAVKGQLTFPTKFSAVEPLLHLDHKGKVIFRMSVNPDEIIKNIEPGTSPLNYRIRALNQMSEAGYQTGILIAPVIFLPDWQALYEDLICSLENNLSEKIKSTGFIEIILMTYSFVHRKINEEAFPNAPILYDNERMTGRGRGKYCYKNELREEAELFFYNKLAKKLPHMQILYIS